MPYTGHVQISQAPLRNCPMIGGEINYSYVLKKLASYEQPIGLEFTSKPPN